MIELDKTKSAVDLKMTSTAWQEAPTDITRETSPLEVEHLSAWYGKSQAIRDISLKMEGNRVTAVIGPSGCGKSTFIRCLNRMHEVTPGAWQQRRILLDGVDILAPGSDPVNLRRRVGMVFQKPNPFPTMSIFENVAAGLRLNRIFAGKGQFAAQVEKSLQQPPLWDDVKDKLNEPATNLSGGQQQRLCIARALAVEPEILLMAEPCSALDPIATLKIEDLIRELVRTYTIIIVTHNMQQAARVSDSTAFLMMNTEERLGELVEFGPTKDIFTNPKDRRTEDYITGRFG
jgi:phosphate transport system ATP-binding protein